MGGLRAFVGVSSGLGLALGLGFLQATAALAGVQDSRFFISPDGTHVEFDIRDAPRREVMARLFADRDFKIEWLNPAFADEPVSGTFSGTPSAVARQLLAEANFVLAYEPGDGRVSRLIIVGRAAATGQVAPGLAALDAAMQPKPLIKPPPAGATAPRLVPVPGAPPPLVPPSPADLALPLIKPVTDPGELVTRPAPPAGRQ